MLELSRHHLQRLARINAGLFVLMWLGVVMTPCAMAHVAMAAADPPVPHDCPHCPPQPCHQKSQPVDCDEQLPIDRLRSFDSSPFLLVLPTAVFELVEPPSDSVSVAIPRRFSPRDGPRTYLLNQRFKE